MKSLFLFVWNKNVLAGWTFFKKVLLYYYSKNLGHILMKGFYIDPELSKSHKSKQISTPNKNTLSGHDLLNKSGAVQIQHGMSTENYTPTASPAISQVG